MNEILALLAGLGIIVFALYLSIKPQHSLPHWKYPAFFSLLFFAFSAYTIYMEGPTGFWVEHSRNFWGNQIWFDLLLFASTALYFLVPRAKALGMRVPLWLIFVIGTGSIGVLAMLARMSYLTQVRLREAT